MAFNLLGSNNVCAIDLGGICFNIAFVGQDWVRVVLFYGNND
jgi:hypothetical protein